MVANPRPRSGSGGGFKQKAPASNISNFRAPLKRKDDEYGPQIRKLSQSPANWSQDVRSSALHYGMGRQLIVSQLMPMSEAMAYPIEGEKVTSPEEVKRILKNLKDSDKHRSDFERSQLRLVGGEQVFVDKESLTRENQKTNRSRALFAEDIWKSLEGSFAHGQWAVYHPHDVASIYKWVMDELRESNQLVLGARIWKLFKFTFKPGMNLQTFYADHTKLRMDVFHENKEFWVPKCTWRSIFMCWFHDDPMFKDDVLRYKVPDDNDYEATQRDGESDLDFSTRWLKIEEDRLSSFIRTLQLGGSGLHPQNIQNTVKTLERGF